MDSLFILIVGSHNTCPYDNIRDCKFRNISPMALYYGIENFRNVFFARVSRPESLHWSYPGIVHMMAESLVKRVMLIWLHGRSGKQISTPW